MALSKMNNDDNDIDADGILNEDEDLSSEQKSHWVDKHYLTIKERLEFYQ